MDALLSSLRAQFPLLQFEAGATFTWSPKNNHVIYKVAAGDAVVASWSLLHEVGHALLKHQSYESDFELLLLEVAAWDKAVKLAKRFKINIDPDHIQDCLDTYRDWLYQRSTCPNCTSCSLQKDKSTYACFNCATVWNVSASRHCRPYRRRASTVVVSND